jgi:hypothetical protein
MMLRGAAAGFTVAGLVLFFMAKIVPLFGLFFFDWMGIMLLGMAAFILFFGFAPSDTGLLYDTIPAGTAVVPFIRRDGIIRPLLFKRIFSGESFLENPRVGLLEDIGKGTVFLWGKKKVRFGIENLNYTPDPHHWPLTTELYELGIDDTDDLYNLRNIPLMDPVKDRQLKEYYLVRMAEVYYRMKNRPERGAKHLVNELMKKQVTKTVFGKKRENMVLSAPHVVTKNPVVEQKTEKKEDINTLVDRRLR